MQEILDKLTETILPKLGIENTQAVIDAISVLLYDYDLTKRSTAVVVYDNGDADIMKRYFVAKLVEGLTETSLKAYKQTLKAFFQNVPKHIKEITTDDVRVFIANKKIAGCKSSTLNNIKRNLSSFFSWCHDEGILTYNPVKKICCIKGIKEIKRPFSEDEMEILRKTTKDPRELALVEFLYSTGCRISEVANVNLADIDFERGEVEVLGKGQKKRIVYINARCKSALKEYLSTRTDKNTALFCGRTGVACTSGTLGKIVRGLGLRAKIDKVHPHRFRRTSATTALSRGMPIDQVRLMLGHEKIETTTIYAQAAIQDVKANHKKFLS